MHRQNVILIVLDGLADQIATQALGCVHAFIEAGQGHHQTLTCELPSMSRPLYETILTGKTPYQSGIFTNSVSRLSKEKSIFHYARDAGLQTAAVAYHWVSELYNQSPYNTLTDRHQHDESKPIQHGIFYHQDHYPDEAVFQDAEYLRTTFSPNFLLIHSMNVDDAGHKFGVDSPEYFRAARKVDYILGNVLPLWLEQGYQILITADHGMNTDRTHGGMADIERQVPLYALGEHALKVCQEGVRQTHIINVVKELLGVN